MTGKCSESHVFLQTPPRQQFSVLAWCVCVGGGSRSCHALISPPAVALWELEVLDQSSLLTASSISHLAAELPSAELSNLVASSKVTLGCRGDQSHTSPPPSICVIEMDEPCGLKDGTPLCSAVLLSWGKDLASFLRLSPSM